MTPTEAKNRWESFTPEERLAMAKAAPKVAGPWKAGAAVVSVRCAVDTIGSVVAMVSKANPISFRACVRDWAEYRPTLAEAQSACDAELVRLGFALDDAEVTRG